MKKYQKQLLSLLAGAVLGYLLYYHFFMDVILLIAHEGFLYMIINIAMLLLSIVGCAAIIYLLLEKRVSRWMLVLLSVTYFIALFIILFCRHRVGRIAILDPLVGLSQLGDWEMLMQSLLNLLMFLPMGFFFRNRKPWQVLLGALGISLFIEGMQYLTMRGMFDTLDSLLYILGISLGALLFRLLRLKIELPMEHFMEILVLSDSHGKVDHMVRAVEQFHPRQVLHLGDCVRDAQALERQFPQLPVTMVPGNCDWGQTGEPERLLEIEGVRILMLHGHTRHVKSSPMAAVYAAREYGADVLLFGHTHVPLVDYDGALWVMNPGAAGDYTRPTCGLLTIREGAVICSVQNISLGR